MNLKAYLFEEDRGVSPVIGVILMVAITVILAAVIATFVMNMGPTETTMPSASFDWNYDSGDGEMDVTHDGGEAVTMSNLKIVVEDSSGSSTTYTEGGGASSTAFSSTPSGDDITASGTISVGGSYSSEPNSAELIWTNPDSDETQILSNWEA